MPVRPVIRAGFDHLKQQGYETVAYVIMPNHVHTILYFPNAGFNLNKIIGNAKRFMAYEIIKRLKQLNRQDIFDDLSNGVKNEKGNCIKYLLILLMQKEFITKSFLIRSLTTYTLILLQVNGGWSMIIQSINIAVLYFMKQEK